MLEREDQLETIAAGASSAPPVETSSDRARGVQVPSPMPGRYN
jgi:hypothetical protein